MKSIEVILCCVRIPNAVLRPNSEFKTMLFNFLGLVNDLSCWKIVFRGLRGQSYFSEFLCVSVYLSKDLYADMHSNIKDLLAWNVLILQNISC